MQLGMIGAGRMGGYMVQRLLTGGHECVVFDQAAERVEPLVAHGASAAGSLADLLARLDTPRIIWLMVPAGAVDAVLDAMAAELRAGDIVVDGGNSHYVADIRRADALNARGIHYIDVGVSGGVWGLERGYCLMIGGDRAVANQLEPIFKTLAPGVGARTAINSPTGAPSTAPHGYLHCGPAGAGHFVKMVHNGIEYALMAAYAEGFNLLAHANAGAASADANTAMPTGDPRNLQYTFVLPEIAEVWRHGSVIGSWLLDLTAMALAADPDLRQFAGRVEDSGEGRWAAHAAIDSATPAPVITTALFQRFDSRGESDLANRLLSAMRHQFGGHQEPPSDA